MIKVVLLDFDGTLVTEDMSGITADIVGMREKSNRIGQDFHTGVSKGLSGLIERINLLKGVTLAQIEEKLAEEEYLMPGYQELLNYLRQQKIVTILASGNIVPVLDYYQEKLKLDYVIGSPVRMRDGAIEGISESDYSDSDFKLFESKKILEKLNIKPEEVLAIGDSVGDKSRFLFAGKSIAINPKEGVEEFADYVIHDDLSQAIKIIEQLNSK